MPDGALGKQEGIGTEPVGQGLQPIVYMCLGGRALLISGPFTVSTLLMQCVSV